MATAEDSWFRIGIYFLIIPFILQQAISSIMKANLPALIITLISIIVVIWIIFCSLCILVPHWIGNITYKLIHWSGLGG